MSDANILRLVLLLIGAIVLAVIWITGQKREVRDAGAQREGSGFPRREPSLANPVADAGEDDKAQAASARFSAIIDDPVDAFTTNPDTFADDEARQQIGRRPDDYFERIVTLYVKVPDGRFLEGSDVVVAAEKVGLVYGYLRIFHRLVDGKPDAGPVFSVANMLKPGYFDMNALAGMRTPGLSLFMTLPGPLPALDAWDMMLPTAQRLAELLDAQVLDDQHNALGRQRIAHIRDELRALDRKQEQARTRW